MTFTQAQAESLYNLVLDAQDAMVSRGEIHASQSHLAVECRWTAAGELLVECSCGRGMFRPTNEQSQGDYALHVANALGLRVRFGRAA